MIDDPAGQTGLLLVTAEKQLGSQEPDGLSLTAHRGVEDIGNAFALMVTLKRPASSSDIKARATSTVGVWELFHSNPHSDALPSGNGELFIGLFVDVLDQRTIEYLKLFALTYCGSEHVYITF